MARLLIVQPEYGNYQSAEKIVASCVCADRSSAPLFYLRGLNEIPALRLEKIAMENSGRCRRIVCPRAAVIDSLEATALEERESREATKGI